MQTYIYVHIFNLRLYLESALSDRGALANRERTRGLWFSASFPALTIASVLVIRGLWNNRLAGAGKEEKGKKLEEKA